LEEQRVRQVLKLQQSESAVDDDESNNDNLFSFSSFSVFARLNEQKVDKQQ
jgi:hypothetical protein